MNNMKKVNSEHNTREKDKCEQEEVGQGQIGKGRTGHMIQGNSENR